MPSKYCYIYSLSKILYNRIILLDSLHTLSIVSSDYCTNVDKTKTSFNNIWLRIMHISSSQPFHRILINLLDSMFFKSETRLQLDVILSSLILLLQVMYATVLNCSSFHIKQVIANNKVKIDRQHRTIYFIPSLIL